MTPTTETTIAKENVKEYGELTSNLYHALYERECKTHASTLRRWLDFLEPLIEDCNEIVNLNQNDTMICCGDIREDENTKLDYEVQCEKCIAVIPKISDIKSALEIYKSAGLI